MRKDHENEISGKIIKRLIAANGFFSGDLYSGCRHDGMENRGSAGFSTNQVNYTSLYVYNGTPYVAYEDAGNSYKATVMALINNYTVTFDSNEGSSVDPVTQDSGTTIAATPTTTKTGSTFAGWYSDSTLTSAVSFPYTITTEVTLYAKWTATDTDSDDSDDSSYFDSTTSRTIAVTDTSGIFSGSNGQMLLLFFFWVVHFTICFSVVLIQIEKSKRTM